MVPNAHQAERLDQVEDRLRVADSATSALFHELIAHTCTRLAAHGAVAKTRFNRLIETGAWTDAALALLALELPQWSLRRLVCDDGIWLCSLSKTPQLPLELDDLAEASHTVAPLAILGALLQARRTTATTAVRTTTVPQMRATVGNAMCCDNFA
jgi:hypothetical protein